MNACEEVLARLHSFLDRELSDDEVAEVKGHLAACSGCEHLVRFEEKLRRLIRVGGCSQEVPPELRARVEARLRSEDLGSS